MKRKLEKAGIFLRVDKRGVSREIHPLEIMLLFELSN
jgi:hypothetical protein